jgi:hypothetical protein
MLQLPGRPLVVLCGIVKLCVVMTMRDDSHLKVDRILL